MKKFLFAFVASISALIVTNEAHAQFSNNLVTLEQAKDADKTGDIFISPKGNMVSMDVNNRRAANNFGKYYKEVKDVKWSKVFNGYTAQFIKDGIKNTIIYNKNGKWAASLKGYTEDKLSRNIRAIVKSKYYDYTIAYVEEIETTDTEGVPTYIVHVEDADNLKLVRVSDGEMDVYKDYIK